MGRRPLLGEVIMFSTFAQQINTRLNSLAEQELFVTLPGDDLWEGR